VEHTMFYVDQAIGQSQKQQDNVQVNTESVQCIYIA